MNHLTWGTNSFEKTLMLGKIEGRRRMGTTGWDGRVASPTQQTWVWVNSGSWWWTGRPGVLQSMGSQRVRRNWATELNWRSYFTFCLSYQVFEIWGVFYIYSTSQFKHWIFIGKSWSVFLGFIRFTVEEVDSYIWAVPNIFTTFPITKGIGCLN